MNENTNLFTHIILTFWGCKGWGHCSTTHHSHWSCIRKCRQHHRHPALHRKKCAINMSSIIRPSTIKTWTPKAASTLEQKCARDRPRRGVRSNVDLYRGEENCLYSVWGWTNAIRPESVLQRESFTGLANDNILLMLQSRHMFAYASPQPASFVFACRCGCTLILGQAGQCGWRLVYQLATCWKWCFR